jgi:hypothetical protein
MIARRLLAKRFFLLATLVGLASSALTQGAPGAGGAVIPDKSRSTAAQQKLEISLLYASRLARGLAPNPGGGGLPTGQAAAAVDAAGFVLVDIATTNAAGLAGPIRRLGGTVVSSFPQYNAVRARVPAKALEVLAAIAAVRTIRPAEMPVTDRITAPR